MTDEWGPWTNWHQGPMPVQPTTVVECQMGNGDYLMPLLAHEVDWDFPGDPIIRYRIRKPRGMTVLQEIVASPERELEGVE